MSHAHNHTSLGQVTIEIAGLDITLPVKFGPGHVLTENQAKVLDAAYQRQFTNNQNASAKSRAEAMEKAKTAEEKAAKAPLTAAQIAELYADYEPSVGGTPRQSTMEKLRQDAAWRFWVAMVTDHNDRITAFVADNPEAKMPKGADHEAWADYEPVIVKAGRNPVQLPTGKGAPEKRDAMAAAILALANGTADKPANAEYAAGVQTQLDAILAERGTKAPTAGADTVVASGADLLGD